MGSQNSRPNSKNQSSRNVNYDLRAKSLGPVLNQLPNEVLLHLFTFLDVVTLCKIAQINIYLDIFTSECYLWEPLFKNVQFIVKNRSKWKRFLSERSINDFHLIYDLKQNQQPNWSVNHARQDWKAFGSLQDSLDYIQDKKSSIYGIFMVFMEGNYAHEQNSSTVLHNLSDIVLFGDTLDAKNINIQAELLLSVKHLTLYNVGGPVKCNIQKTGKQVKVQVESCELTTASKFSLPNCVSSFVDSKGEFSISSNGGSCIVERCHATLEANGTEIAVMDSTIASLSLVKGTGKITNSVVKNSSTSNQCSIAFTKCTLENTLAVTGGSMKMSNCSTKTQHHGIKLTTCEAEILDSKVVGQSNWTEASNRTTGITITDCSAVIKNCKVKHFHYGFAIHGSGKPLLQNNRVVLNFIGVLVASNSSSIAKPVMKGNRILYSKASGLCFNKNCAGKLYDNEISFSNSAGVTIMYSAPIALKGSNNILCKNLKDSRRETGVEHPKLLAGAKPDNSIGVNHFKVGLIGSGGCGRMAWLFRFCNNEWATYYHDHYYFHDWKTQTYFEEQPVWLEFWRSVYEEYTALRDLEIKQSHAIMLCFSITSRSSYDEVPSFRERVFRVHDTETFPFVLVGFKSDLENEREVSRQEALELASTWKCPYIECSSKNNINVKEITHEVLYQVLYMERAPVYYFPSPPNLFIEASTFYQDLVSMINNTKVADFKFILDNGAVHANLLIVITKCPHMMKFIKEGTTELTVKDCPQTIFELFLRYIYTGALTLTSHTVNKLKELAQRFEVHQLVINCDKFIKHGSLKIPLVPVAHHFSILFNADVYSDVIFEFDSDKIFAHRIILLARCPKLLEYMTQFTLDTSSNNDSNNDNNILQRAKLCIPVKEFPREAFSKFMEFLYTDNVKIEPSVATDVLWMAVKFSNRRLASICECVIAPLVTSSNAVTVWEMARTTSVPLQEFCKHFIAYHHSAVAKSKDYQQLSPERKKEVDSLKVVTELKDPEAVYQIFRCHDKEAQPMRHKQLSQT